VNLLGLPKRALRVNKVDKSVGVLQQALAHFGYEIVQDEYAARQFGKTTRAAVVAYQTSHGLQPSGHVERDTLKAIQEGILRANPRAAAGRPTHRVRGSVRYEAWVGQSNVVVRVYENTENGENLLAERTTLETGFYDIAYVLPVSTDLRRQAEPCSLVVRALGANGQELGAKTVFDPIETKWANFTQGKTKFRGCSEFGKRKRRVKQGTLEVLAGSPEAEMPSRLSRKTGLAVSCIP